MKEQRALEDQVSQECGALLEPDALDFFVRVYADGRPHEACVAFDYISREDVRACATARCRR